MCAAQLGGSGVALPGQVRLEQPQVLSIFSVHRARNGLPVYRLGPAANRVRV